MFCHTFITIAMICAIPSAYTYSAGAPEQACINMTPQHHVDPQLSEAPYNLILSSDKLTSGQSVDIKIQGKSAGDTIKGFMIQARIGDKPVGQFTVKSKKHSQLLNCLGGSGVSRKLKEKLLINRNKLIECLANSNGRVNKIGIKDRKQTFCDMCKTE